MQNNTASKIFGFFVLIICSHIMYNSCSINILQGSGDKNTDNSEHFGETTTISQHGITWVFAGTVEYGTYINGDYWILGPVDIISIDPPAMNYTDPETSDTYEVNGSMLNPVPGEAQGYSGSIYDYSTNLNVTKNVSATQPITLEYNDVMISSIHTDHMRIDENGDPHRRDVLWASAILTVVDVAPPENSFRPGYCDPERTIYSANNLRTEFLENFTPQAFMPDPEDIISQFQGPWLEHKEEWVGSHIHAHSQMPFYGRDIAEAIGDASLMLHTNISPDQKDRLMYRFIQYGIDLYSIAVNGGERNWINNGGHASGRKWPILFAGIMLNELDLMNIGQRSGDYLYTDTYGPGNPPEDYIHFGEDDQTFYITQADIDRTNSLDWNPDDRRDTAPYENFHLGWPGWGIAHSTIPTADNAAWNCMYRRCCTATAWGGIVLAAHIMDENTNSIELWNHDALFDYQDRYMAMELTMSQPYRQDSKFTENMWDAYRENFGPVWTGP